MKLIDLQKILAGDVSLIEKVNAKDVMLYGDEVPVHPKDVEYMLKRYLDGSLAGIDLSKWAKFLCVRGEYGCLEQVDGQDEDYYESMWDVLQALSEPEIDGEISRARVEKDLNELRKYNVK